MSRVVRAVFGIAALVCALASIRPAGASPEDKDPKKWIPKTLAALEKPDAEVLQTQFDPWALTEPSVMAQSREDVWTVARAMERYVPRLGAEKADLAQRMVEWLFEVVGKVRVPKKATPAPAPAPEGEGSPPEGDDGEGKPTGIAYPAIQLRAAALARATRARLSIVTGGKPAGKDWQIAADLALASYDAQGDVKEGADGGELLAMAFGWLQEALSVAGVEAGPIEERAAAIEKLAAGMPAGPYPTAIKGAARLAKLEKDARATPATSPAAMKAGLEALFAGLAAYAKPDGHVAPATVHNRGVTFMRANKIGFVKAEYVLAPRVPGLDVTWQLPVSSGWRVRAKGESDQDTFVGAFEQIDAEGRTIREGLVEMFKWEKNYPGKGGSSAKGDATKDLARQEKDGHASLFSKTTKDKDLVKGPFSNGMPPAQFYEMVGLDVAEKPLRVRAHFIRGRETKGTFKVAVVDHAVFAGDDPEMDAVYASFFEVHRSR